MTRFTFIWFILNNLPFTLHYFFKNVYYHTCCVFLFPLFCLFFFLFCFNKLNSYVTSLCQKQETWTRGLLSCRPSCRWCACTMVELEKFVSLRCFLKRKKHILHLAQIIITVQKNGISENAKLDPVHSWSIQALCSSDPLHWPDQEEFTRWTHANISSQCAAGRLVEESREPD